MTEKLEKKTKARIRSLTISSIKYGIISILLFFAFIILLISYILARQSGQYPESGVFIMLGTTFVLSFLCGINFLNKRDERKKLIRLKKDGAAEKIITYFEEIEKEKEKTREELEIELLEAKKSSKTSFRFILLHVAGILFLAFLAFTFHTNKYAFIAFLVVLIIVGLLTYMWISFYKEDLRKIKKTTERLARPEERHAAVLDDEEKKEATISGKKTESDEGK